MGTRSRLVIYRSRSGKKPFYLWMHWDGYFSGVGDWLCAQIKLLLEKYSVEQIETMLEALELTDTDNYQCFKTEDLIPFIEGKTSYGNDMCDDIEYEYRLDFHRGTFIGMGHDETRSLHLDQIRVGALISDDEPAPASILSDKTNLVFEMVAAALKTLTDAEKTSMLERLKHV
jgi:hypothetical protein